MAIETILSDVGGVLIKSYDTSENVRKRVNLPESTFKQLWRPLLDSYGSAKISEETIWQTFAEHGGSLVDLQENALAKPFENNLTIYKDVIKTLKQLGRNGYKLAILSNTNANHAEVLDRYGVYEPFDNVFLSHLIGVRKPHPDIYTHALEAMSIEDPSTVLFIDDRQANLDTAKKLGMQTVLSLDNEESIIHALHLKLT